MDASDMGLPADELLRRLNKLVQQGFDFEDLMAAEQLMQEQMVEIASVICKHDRGPFKGMKMPHIKVTAEDLPSFVDGLIQAGFSHPGVSASLAIKLTNSVRHFNSESAKSKLKELLSAMTEAADYDLTIKLVMDTCARELQ